MVDFTRFMGAGALEPRFSVPNLGSLPAPTPIAPPPAPLPSVAPAPMPAPIAPLPNIGNIDLSNLDLSGLPGLPQMPLPPPAVPPIDTAPPPAVPPIDMAPPPAVPPFEIAPAPVPEPIMPPPLPPRPVNRLEPVSPMEIAPGPITEPVTPPPLPPTPFTTVPPLEVAPGPIPEPVMPPPLPPQNTFLPPEFMEQLPNFDRFVPPAPTPEPVAPPIPLEPGDGLVPMAPGNFAGVLPANPVVQEPVPAVTGIETLAPEDYTESVASFEGIPMPDGTVLSMNEIGEAQGFDPFGVAPNFMLPQSEGIETLSANVLDAGTFAPEATELPANTVDFGYGAVEVEDLAAIGVPGFGLDAETGEVTFDADQMTGTTGGPQTANAQYSYTPSFDNMYVRPEEEPGDDFTFGGGDTGGTTGGTTGGYTMVDTNNNGIDDRVEDYVDGREGVDVNGNTGGTTTGTGTTGGSTSAGTGTTSGYGSWYDNLSDEQRAAFDTWMANNTANGIITTPLGSFNLNQYTGTGTGTTTVTPVDPVANLTVPQSPPAPTDPRVATNYRFDDVIPAVITPNPFQRPESQQGIGSLAGGG